MEEHEFGNSSDEEDADIRVPVLPSFSPIPFRGGENMEDSGDCDGVGRVFEDFQFFFRNRKFSVLFAL